jgi:hypothetical protein
MLFKPLEDDRTSLRGDRQAGSPLKSPDVQLGLQSSNGFNLRDAALIPHIHRGRADNEAADGLDGVVGDRNDGVAREEADDARSRLAIVAELVGTIAGTSTSPPGSNTARSSPTSTSLLDDSKSSGMSCDEAAFVGVEFSHIVAMLAFPVEQNIGNAKCAWTSGSPSTVRTRDEDREAFRRRARHRGLLR